MATDDARWHLLEGKVERTLFFVESCINIRKCLQNIAELHEDLAVRETSLASPSPASFVATQLKLCYHGTRQEE